MPKYKSRATRWADAVADARKALDEIQAIRDGDLSNALSELNELKSEYEGWKDSLPENLASSPVGEKLEAVCGLDFDSDDLDTIESSIGEAEGIDLPLGFGRD